MLYRELEKIECELEELAGLEVEALQAPDLDTARRKLIRLHFATNRILVPYRAQRESKSHDRGDTFTTMILNSPREPRTITI